MKTSITQRAIESILALSQIDVCTKFQKVTVVTVRLPNGFVLVESAGAVDKANYSEEIGREVCLEPIKNKLWELEGYRLSSRIADEVALGVIANEVSWLCRDIEKIPASPEQTAASLRASNLSRALEAARN